LLENHGNRLRLLALPGEDVAAAANAGSGEGSAGFARLPANPFPAIPELASALENKERIGTMPEI
jgi:hypothetical protein